MEDYILREIDRIGELITALMKRLGLVKHTPEATQAVAATKTELAAQLDIDIDTLLCDPDFVLRLKNGHHFGEEDLEKFAELLFDMAAATTDHEERQQLAAGVGAIYSYLDEHKFPVSINRYYLLKELDRLVGQSDENEKPTK